MAKAEQCVALLCYVILLCHCDEQIHSVRSMSSSIEQLPNLITIRVFVPFICVRCRSGLLIPRGVQLKVLWDGNFHGSSNRNKSFETAYTITDQNDFWFRRWLMRYQLIDLCVHMNAATSTRRSIWAEVGGSDGLTSRYFVFLSNLA